MAANTTQVVTVVGGVKTGMTALAGGAAPTLAANTLERINVASTVASDGDSLILPALQPEGAVVYVVNQDSAQDIHVFPNTGATIQGGTASTGDIAIGQTQAALFIQVGDDGLTWVGMYGAVFAPV